MKTFFETEGFGKQEYYRSIIFDIVRKSRQITRAEISRLYGIRPAAVTQIASDFLSRGVLREARKNRSGKGRSQLGVNPDLACSVGLELGPGYIKTVVMDAAYGISAEDKTRIPVESGENTLIPLILTCLEAVISTHTRDNLKGIGFADPGLVDPAKGASLMTSILRNWKGVPVGKLIEEKFGVPVLVQGANHVRALAEMLFGKGKTARNFIYINLSVGVGANLVIDGRIYHGASNLAGEFGHTIVKLDGPYCNCGGRGCLETICGKLAIARSAAEKIKSGAGSVLAEMVEGDLERITGPLVVEAAQKGDRLALDVIYEAGKYLGIAVVNLINVLNPSLIVFGGSMMKAGDLLLEPVERMVRTRALKHAAENLRLEVSGLGEYIAAIGAAALVMEEFFKPVKLEKNSDKKVLSKLSL
ncbi:MAG: ROK family protein [Candidatus Glassbacteria bacterium]|nr:ROK family protein [Candidatus Glassbacteria bacterium]